VFVNVARLDLEAHLPTMCDFWETVLFRTRAYRGSAFASHLELHLQEPLTERHFKRWLAIWTVTVDDRFVGPVADAAKAHANRVASAFQGRFKAHDARAAPSS
jgi:hemoglobin